MFKEGDLGRLTRDVAHWNSVDGEYLANDVKSGTTVMIYETVEQPHRPAIRKVFILKYNKVFPLYVGLDGVSEFGNRERYLEEI